MIPTRYYLFHCFSRRNVPIRRKLVFSYLLLRRSPFPAQEGGASPALSQRRDALLAGGLPVEVTPTGIATEAKLPILMTPLPGPNA